MSDQQFDMNSLLDGTLDDLADMPEFKPYPPGAHKVIVTIKMETAFGNAKKKGFTLNFVAEETLQLNNPEDTPLEKGAKGNIFLDMGNEFGQGGMKLFLKAAAVKFGAKSNRELIDAAQNAEIAIVTDLRSNKEKTAEYLQVKEYAFI